MQNRLEVRDAETTDLGMIDPSTGDSIREAEEITEISATAEKEEEVLTQTALDQETEVIAIEEIEKEGDLTTDPTEEKTRVKKKRTIRETAAEVEIVKETQSTKTG